MAWTFPKTWFAGELLTASLLNTHLRDNLNALKFLPKDRFVDNAASYSTTSTTFVDVDTTNLTLTIETTGGDALVLVTGTVSITGALWTDRVNLGVTCDGTLHTLRP